MLKTKKYLTMLILVVANLHSAEMFYGSKPLSMANAYTSVSSDIFSLFYNPAGLSSAKTFSLSTDFGGSYNFSGGILYNVNNIIVLANKFSEIEKAQKQGLGIDVTQITALFDAIKNLNDLSFSGDGKGVLATVNGGVALNIKNYGFSVRNYTVFGLKPTIDTGFYLGTGPIMTSSLHRSLNFNMENFGGITIPSDSTGTVKPELLEIQQELKKVVEDFLTAQLLKDLGISLPDGITSEQIANALINIAEANNVSVKEIKDAVTKLSDPNFQNMIRNFIETNLLNLKKKVFADNQSGVLFKGLNVTEINFSYAREIFVPEFYLGANLKYLIGTSLYYNFLVFNEQEKLDFNDIASLASLQNKITKNSNAITLDLGTIYRIPVIPIKTQIGLTVKNLIEPEFELAGTSEKLKLPRKVKFGSSIELLKVFTLAMDYDLLKTESFVPGYNNQNLSFGFEFKPPLFLSLRAGYLRNLAMPEDEMITGGLGIKIFAFNFDLAGAMSTQSVNIDNNLLVPTNAAVSLSIRLDF